MAIGSLVSSYEAVLLQNASRISSIESSLRSISWLLPGRFQDAELASEGLYSILNILGLYHDSILQRSISALPPPLRPSPSPHARYTRHWAKSSSLYSRAAHLLQLLNYAELLLEMSAGKKLGKARAGDSVLAIEAVKALLRLAILVKTGRPSINPPIAQREVDPSLIEQYTPEISGAKAGEAKSNGSPLPRSAADVVRPSATELNGQSAEGRYWTGAKTSNTYPSLASLRTVGEPAPGDSTSSFGAAGVSNGAREALEAFLQTRVLSTEDATPADQLVHRIRGKATFAELLWIARPLLYVLAMRRYGRKHTLPYLLSLSVEYVAYHLRTQAAAQRKTPPTSVEEDESARRRRAFLWYILRGPVWDSWTRPRLEGVQGAFEDKPLIGFVATLLKDYIPLIDEYYYYTS